MKREPKNHKNKRKIGEYKKSFIFGPKFAGFWGPRPAYSAYTKVNLLVGRGPVNSGFTGPGWALDALAFWWVIFNSSQLIKVELNTK
jgi:hypothetical protein